MKKSFVVFSFLVAGLFITSLYNQPEKEIKTSKRRIKNKLAKESLSALKQHKEHSHKVKSKSRKPSSINIKKVQMSDTQKEIVLKVLKALPQLEGSQFKFSRSLPKDKKSIFVISKDNDGYRRSFTALVDDESGRVIKTWGKEHHERSKITRYE